LRIEKNKTQLYMPLTPPCIEGMKKLLEDQSLCILKICKKLLTTWNLQVTTYFGFLGEAY